MENKFKENTEVVSKSVWPDWKEQLKESELHGLFQRLETMDREILLEWLQWFNPKGNYTDRKCMENGVKMLSKHKALQYTYKEIYRIHVKKQHSVFSTCAIPFIFEN